MGEAWKPNMANNSKSIFFFKLNLWSAFGCHLHQNNKFNMLVTEGYKENIRLVEEEKITLQNLGCTPV